MQLRNNTLQGLTGLFIHDLGFYGNYFILHPIEADFLKPVENAKILTISYEGRKASISNALRVLLHPFKNKSVDSIRLTNIRDTVAIDLRNDDFQILRTICVKKLSLAQNYIMEANLNVLIGSKLWDCLETFDISKNMARDWSSSYIFLLSLPQVKSLNICCQRIITDNLLISNNASKKRDYV